MLKVSIIVPVYGVEKYIERCCISIFEQTYKNFEVVFVNDCTKDKSEEIVLALIERYKYLSIHTRIIKHEVNKGISATRQTGQDAATGEYILYVDSDDYIALDMLDTLVQRADDTNADVVYCDYYEVESGKYKYQDQSLSVSDPILVTAAMLRGEIRWCPWNKLFRRSITVENDINWPAGVNVGEDLAVLPRIFHKAKKIEHVNQALYFYNRDNVNSYLNIWSPVSCYQNIKSVEALGDYFNIEPQNSILIEALDQTKLMTKYLMLYSFNKELVKLIVDIFPETNGKVFSYKSTSFYWKIALYLVVKKRRALSWLAMQTIWWFKKVRAFKML